MKYQIVMLIDDSLEMSLYEVDVKKSEIQEIRDALECELKYNGFDILEAWMKEK